MKQALITGGSRGIGRACVEELCRLGWSVTFCFLNHEEEARALAARTGATAVRCDVGDWDAASALVEAVAAGGGLDLLVNNAAVSLVGLTQDVTRGEWERLLAVNLTGPFACVRAALPHMIRRGGGRIVNVSSVWGVKGASCEAAYSATKAALIGLTRALAQEVGPAGITVNAVAPGVIDTDMNANLTGEDRAELAERTPLGRLGTPEDVARAVAYLASEDAGFVTGQVLGVDGGFGL